MRRNLKNAYVLEAMELAAGTPCGNRAALLRFAGVTHQDLADKIGLKRATITNTMNEERTNRNTQQAIADILQVDREKLFKVIPDEVA